MFQQDAAESIRRLTAELNNHALYRSIQTVEDLRLFMAHHVYSVWDFMGLLKYLQHQIAPSKYPWSPTANTLVRRFINSIVLAEESDLGLPDAEGNSTFASHFELYTQAMDELDSDPLPAMRFASYAARYGFGHALIKFPEIPAASQVFMRKTCAFIRSDKPHVVAAAFAFGREQIIPAMFQALLAGMDIDHKQAPLFHHYLQRHIDLDEHEHSPLALRMLQELCEDDHARVLEAEQAAIAAIQARIQLWDGVLNAIKMGLVPQKVAS